MTEKDITKAFEKLEDVDEFIVRAFFMLSVLTGWRRAEIASLEWDSIDFDRKIIRIRRNMSKQPTDFATIPIPHGVKNVYAIKTTKTDRERNYPMDEQLEKIFIALKEYHEKLKLQHPSWETMVKLYSLDKDKRLAPPEPRNLVFRWENGEYMRPDYMTKWHKKFMKKIFKEKTIRLHDERHSYAQNMLKDQSPMNEVQALLGHSRISTTIDQYGRMDGEDCRKSAKKYSSKYNIDSLYTVKDSDKIE